MKKKLLLLALALVMLLSANLRPCYALQVDGAELEELYSPAQLRRCEQKALEAAEELLSGPAELPRAERKLALRFQPARGDEAALTKALLLSVPGLCPADEVLINGTRLGTVEDGRELFERLRQSILNQMPNAAAVGNLSGRLQTRRVISREGAQTNYEDMILLITGMAPVIYVDNNGKLC